MSAPEIITVNSEALEAQIRDLLPSQNGFGSELQASNVIMPIIDLTSAAEGSALPAYLANALSFGSQTVFDHTNGTNDVIANAGFWRVSGTWAIVGTAASVSNVQFRLNDGSSNKVIFSWEKKSTTTMGTFNTGDFDFNIFLNAGEKLETVTNAQSRTYGSVRQLASITGEVINPSGFVAE